MAASGRKSDDYQMGAVHGAVQELVMVAWWCHKGRLPEVFTLARGLQSSFEQVQPRRKPSVIVGWGGSF